DVVISGGGIVHGALLVRRRRATGSKLFAARRTCFVTPHFACNFNDQTQLRELLVFGEAISFGRARETALRAERELVEIDEFRGLVDAALQQVLRFQL